MSPLMPDEIRKELLFDDVYIVETERGYVITDGVLTDWLEQVNEAPTKFVYSGTFGNSQHIKCVIADFIDKAEK